MPKTENTVSQPAPDVVGDWMQGLPAFGSNALAPAPPAKEKEAEDVSPKTTPETVAGSKPDSGGTDAKPTGGPAADKGVAKPAPAASSTPASTEKAVPDADKGKDKGTPAPATASEEPAKAEDIKPEDWEKETWPRKQEDWAKFKEKRKARETTLQKAISEREAELAKARAEHEALKKELEGKTPQQQINQAEFERIKKENEEYSEALRIAEVTAHPKFKRYYDDQLSGQIGLAKEIVGNENAAKVEELLSLPKSEYRTAGLRDMLVDMDDLARTRLGGVLNRIEEIQRDRQAAIQRNKEDVDKIQAERTAQQKQASEQAEKLFTSIVSEIQDPKNGFLHYQTKDGDNAWNSGVAERINRAKELLSGKFKPDVVMRAALHAVIMPEVLASYSADRKAWESENATLKAQVAKLTAAQPSADKGSAAESPNSGKAPQKKDTSNLPPWKQAEAWASELQNEWTPQ